MATPETAAKTVDPITLIAELREKLDALEASLGGEEMESEEPGASIPAPAPSDEELMAGISPKRKPDVGMFGR